MRNIIREHSQESRAEDVGEIGCAEAGVPISER